MIDRLESVYRKARRWISRSELGIRLLGLSRSAGTESDPGLVLIQIDGLARRQLEKALENGKMPFLERLIKKEGYHLHTHYSGLPASTPAVQGELFYGVEGAVPAFSFLDKKLGGVVRMFDTEACARLQSELEQKNPGLLEGGSSYCNIFSGGAMESHFCPATFGWSSVLRAANPLTLAGLLLFQGWSLVRIAGLLGVELVLAVIDCVRGLIDRRDLMKELKFVPTRVALCILLRELITIGAQMDVARGLPVVHFNLIGYDEQAHRRGPSSNFAHWTLKGIDQAIKRVFHAAKHSSRRDYEIWVYSDHGQEETIPFPHENHQTIEDAVAGVFANLAPLTGIDIRERKGIQLQRSQWIGGPFLNWLFGEGTQTPQELDRSGIVVTAMGSLGHVYCPWELEPKERNRIAALLVKQARIPLVLLVNGSDQVEACTASGTLKLPEDAAQILGPEHAFLKEAARDLVRLCHHPNAGDFIISGWRRGGRSVSFPLENGSHTGPGPDETRAFVLAPVTAPIPNPERGYFRPADLREGALYAMEKKSPPRPRRSRLPGTSALSLRIMTYNVHSCIGMDGKISPARIAKVIAQYDPDIVALQELDVRRPRTGEVDQAHAIAQDLEMEFHFHPAFQLEEELYGNAILSRHTMRLVRAGSLPGLPNRPNLEQRGAIWVAITVDAREVQLINTHLGLRRKEKILQAEALLGEQWLAHPDCREPVILCGDFNATPNSPVCRRLTRKFRDTQRILNNHTPQRTWFGRYPVGRIDHVFVGKEIQPVNCLVPRTVLTRLASDHLPLIVELEIPLR